MLLPLYLTVLSKKKKYSLKESHRRTSPMGSHFYEVPRVIKPIETGSRRRQMPGAGEGIKLLGLDVKDGSF